MALTFGFDANAGETPETIAQRRMIAQSIAARMTGNTPKNLGEGIGSLGDALLFRKMYGDANDAQAAGMATLPAEFGGTGGAATPSANIASMITGQPQASLQPTAPAVASAPMGNLPAMSPQPDTAGKIYNNNEPSPLDPPSGADRDAMIKTILGEAGNEPQLGKNAVASVIRTRAVDGGYGGDTPQGVVTAKNQFEPWNTQDGRDRMARAAANPQQYAAADQAIASAYGEGGKAPEDPTEGMTHFYSPAGQAAMGRTAPKWAGGESVTIGGHVFNSPDDGTGTPQTQLASNDPTALPANTQPAQAAPNDPAALPPNSQPAQFAVPGQQAQPAPAPAASTYGGPLAAYSNADLLKYAGNKFVPPHVAQALQAEMTRRATIDNQAADPVRQLDIQQKNLAIKKAQQELDQTGDFKVIGENSMGKKAYGFVDKAGKVTPYNPDGGSSDGGEFGDMNKTGAEYLATVPKQQALTMQGMVDGTVQPPSSFAAAKPYWQSMLAGAKNIDPNFDMNTWATRHKMSADMGASSNSSMGGILSNGKSAFKHLAEYTDSASGLGNASHDFPLGSLIAHGQNYVGNTLGGSDTSAKIKAISTNLGHFGQEATKFYSGTGGGVEERMNALKEMNPTTVSSSEMASYALKEKSLMLDRLHEKEAQIRDTMGDQYLQKHPVITPDLQTYIDRIDANVSKLNGTTPPDKTNALVPMTPVSPASPNAHPDALAEARRRGLIK